MEEREVAIRLSGVKKEYRLGRTGGGTLQGDLQSWWARLRGREDPNGKLGQERRLEGRLEGRRFMALNGIDLTVYKGEALGIIGANGAGKSTLLKLLCRITAPTAGEIDLYGRVASMLEVGAGFHGEMTGRENVYMNGAMLGMRRAEINEKLKDIIEFSEVGEFIDTPVKRYSSGMYVRLAFSVAAHLDSEILIMDEVLAVGDMAFQRKCLERMRRAAAQEGRTVLYVSHNMNTIRQLCSRCVVLEQGRVSYDGDVEEAIGVYTDARSGGAAFVDFTRRGDAPWLRDPALRLRWVELGGGKPNAVSEDGALPLRLQWRMERDVERLSLRIEVYSPDEIPRAAYVLPDFCGGRRGETITAALSLDAGNLAEARYQLKLVFFERDGYGNSRNVGFGSGVFFEKKDQEKENALLWNPGHWGYVRQRVPELLALRREPGEREEGWMDRD